MAVEMSEHPPQPIGLIMLALALGAVFCASSCGTGSGAAADELRAETQARDCRIASSRETLARLAEFIRTVGCPKTDGSGDDPTGLKALALHAPRTDFMCERTREYFTNVTRGSCSPVDAADGWNRPVRYRCPGPVHTHGWDVYSVGPNGIDEHGGGDDILIGEDVADVGSGH